LLRVLVAVSNLYRRVLTVFLAIVGPGVAYRITGRLARLLYQRLPPVRARCEAQCRAALAGRLCDAEAIRVARESFVHRVWNLTDLMLADRLLHANTFQRYGGVIPEPHFSILRSAQQNHHPVILLTAYYGSFDLLPVFLGYNGIRAGVVYRPHPNPDFDAYRRRIRGRSGCELIPVHRAANRLAEILEGGGIVAILADHHAERRGVPVTFLGLPTQAMRSVGLLAWRYNASIAVAGIRRLDNEFRFEIVVSDVLHSGDWQSADDPVAHITADYMRKLEQVVLGDPTQYLWGHARWGEAFARELTGRGDLGVSSPRPQPE
jgi:lauroyl/myristoyl acyltransferase